MSHIININIWTHNQNPLESSESLDFLHVKIQVEQSWWDIILLLMRGSNAVLMANVRHRCYQSQTLFFTKICWGKDDVAAIICCPILMKHHRWQLLVSMATVSREALLTQQRFVFLAKLQFLRLEFNFKISSLHV